jgi:LacI family gluconate utilization system Gnt-I transcriptional repressor
MARRSKSSGPGRSRSSKGQVTLRDVAQRAGVAMMTASRALRSPATVSEKLRVRIDEAVHALGYVQNRFAGGLASEHTELVTVIVPLLSSRVFMDILRGADDVLSRQGYQILFSNTFYSLEQEEEICRRILGWQPDGVIIAGVDHTDGTRELLSRSGVPVVEALELGEHPVDINVGLSHRAAGQRMTEYLLAKGYRRVGFIGADPARDFRALRRFQGYTDALEAAGRRPAYVAAAPSPTSYRSGAEMLRIYLESGKRADALFCANDELAVGALLECRRQGVQVPGDLAIAGFNGLEIGQELFPRLTTVLTPRYRIGQIAAESILARLADPTWTCKRVDVGFEILEGESA